ncbi:sigma-54 interaction domain-containing protein [Spirosoma utsteinense]|uniref:Transcriptional regulator with PAS, ATPase and Fis domain n=1 Tax=Spirosoma utsteinense TaxID=2585773 RepID=A0ABR6W7V9_9BACT|nr:sigma-54 dependent transcriptional regulator [Spirosoma utsteinense]MBC3785869.1 transcriptional regulator with PAS, ATPase and Fis domain [Spirosoma utsteinense]MBC3792041.1 transcriptional regulator with PAS, ATPase and Fis domain [Spirosoma utsteinense]
MNNQEILSVKQRFGIIGNAPALNYAINVGMQVAATDLTVLITGESGSGKESFSKIIHSLSARKHGQFIAINCGAIPEGTIDSELFGHEKGSFTGAVDSRKGYFETTNGGTIFLDEIGEMPLGTQARLLRVLENGEFIRVGSSKTQKTDVRVVAATNVNLMDAVEKGKFREDLYYRLNTVPIFVPPLRERGTDIELLFRKFTTDFAERYRIKPLQLTEEAKQLLISFPFPGNIRQLKNIAEQISILESEQNKPLEAETLAKYLPQTQQPNRSLALFPQANGPGAEHFSERELLYKVLFDMRRDMNDLKKLVRDVLGNEQDGRQILNNHKDLFDSIPPDGDRPAGEGGLTRFLPPPGGTPHSEPRTNGTPPPPSETYGNHPPVQIYDDVDGDVNDVTVEDVTHETEDDDSLSLERQEKEMILKALRRNNNKRKYAAQALGISERTLYRKIKQYEIDEE